MKQLKLLFLSTLITISACSESFYKLSKEDQDPLTMNSDNRVYKYGQSFRYAITYFDSNGVEKGLIMEQDQLDYNDTYPVIDLDSSLTNYQNRLKYVDVLVEDPWNELMINTEQSTITYHYYTFANSMVPFASQTGVIDNKHNLWVHPPRNSALKILNMSAYPFAKFPLRVGKKWEYSIPIGRLWGHNGFGSNWEEKDIPVFTHSYQVKEMTQLNHGGRVLECYHIEAKSESKLGTSSSDFYYNDDYGFVSMRYNNLDGSVIQMVLLAD